MHSHILVYDPGNSRVPQCFKGMQCFHLLELRCPGTMQNTAKGYGILRGYLNPWTWRQCVTLNIRKFKTNDSVTSQQKWILNKATVKTSNLACILVLKFHHNTYIITNTVRNNGQSALWVKSKCLRSFLSGRTASEQWQVMFCHTITAGEK